MKIKVGSKIFVPSTEVYGEVTKIEGQESDLTIWVQWENFPHASYDYNYNEARGHWEVLVAVSDLDCVHANLKKYIGITEVYQYCDDCKIKIYKTKPAS